LANDKDRTTFKEAPLLALKGFIMGSADIIPGVSGGTMALILGIYKRLLDAIKSVDAKTIGHLLRFRFKELFELLHWKFIITVLGGIFSAVIFFTKIVPLQVFMFSDPELIYGLFFGLIVGSIYILYKSLDDHRWLHLLFLATGILVGFWIVTLVPTNTPETPWFVFLSGSLAITAMIMPGISGSYILLILRKYNYILSNIGQLGTESTLDALMVLIPFGLGALAGLALFSRLLSWLLDTYYSPTLLVLIGFLIGSLYVIWPYQERTYKTFEQVKKTIPVDSDLAKELKQNPPETDQPEYHKLGKTEKQDGVKYVEYIEVKNKLISSVPYLPFFTEEDIPELPKRRFWEGIIGMVVGMALVGALERIR